MILDERLATSRLAIDTGAIVRNWKRLAAMAPGSATGAAVKADAYGHGLEPVAHALVQAGCSHFFTANPSEGVALRQVAGEAEIFVLAGLSIDNVSICREAALTPVLNHWDDIALWAEWNRASGLRLPCALHVDTGMNRLGLTLREAAAFAADEKLYHSVTPALVMSHFACADDPGHPMNAAQMAAFAELRSWFPGTRASLANSAGILGQQGAGHDITRPGIALYGGEAIDGDRRGMEPAATLEARILQIRDAKKGETVGYGASAELTRDSRIAIAGIGYGDGVNRAASGAGVALRQTAIGGAKGWLATASPGIAVPVIGRISMDTMAFDVTDVPQDVVAQAQWIEIFGSNIRVDDFARAAGTIGYEALTQMGRRAAKVWR